MFGGLFDKKEKAEYEADMARLQAMQHQMDMQQQIERQKLEIQMNMAMAQNTLAERPGLLSGITVGNTALGAQGLTSVSDSGSIILRNMQSDIRELRINIEHISGFYKWIIHAYPETLVQYKALKELEAVSRGQEESESTSTAQYAAKSAI